MSQQSREVVLSNALVDVSIEGWRFLRAMERATSDLDAEQQRRAVSRCDYFRNKLVDALERLDLWFVSLDGTRYDPGLAASVLNADEFPGADDLVVDQTIEPVVMGSAGVVRPGIVTLRRIIA